MRKMKLFFVHNMFHQVFYFSLLFLCLPVNITAQININAIPYSISENLQPVTSFVEMEPFDMATVLNEDKKQQSDGIKNYRFAHPFYVNLNPENSGEWINTSKGRVWRLGIRTENAFSVYLTFNSFHLNKGVNVFIYSLDYNEFRGAFSNKNNTNSNIFSIAPITGDAIIIELDIPMKTTDYGKLNISKVYHDYVNEFGSRKSSNFKETFSNACEESINCINGKYWQTEKRAVCKIIIDGGLSTGTLIGNTSGGNEPYLITANHSMFDSLRAAGAIFYFNYENTSCGSALIDNWQTLSGSSLIATTNKLDFSLVKLNEIPPFSYKPYYAGWDINNTIPQSGVSIHHPWGREKQIAIEYHPLTAGTFNQDFDTLSSWKVSQWDIGTTEPGSSGAPLFNQQHRLIGTLTGGNANCEITKNDYFSRFCMDWENYPESDNQLKVWLDPLQKGFTCLDGYDPYGFNMSNCDTAWNIQNHEKLDLSSSGLNWGWISGHNSSLINQFAEKFNSPSSIQLSGLFLNVAKAYYSRPLSNIVLKVWEGNVVPADEKYSKIIFIRSLQPDAINYIDFDSVVKVTGNFFIGYELNFTDPVDSFAVYHTGNRGKTGTSTLFVYDGKWQNINTISSMNLSTSLGIGIIECYGKIHKPEISSLKVYPNPCNNYIYLDIPHGMIVNGIECFDYTGRQVPVEYQPSEENNKLIFNLPSGVYFIKILTQEKQLSARFAVLNNK